MSCFSESGPNYDFGRVGTKMGFGAEKQSSPIFAENILPLPSLALCVSKTDACSVPFFQPHIFGFSDLLLIHHACYD